MLIIRQPHVVYSLSFDQFVLRYSTEPYLRKMHFDVQRLALIDTSPESGPYPIIIDTKIPVVGSLTMYQSWLLQEKHKMSSLLNITISEPKVFFLKKKIMEVTNFILNTLKQIFP